MVRRRRWIGRPERGRNRPRQVAASWAAIRVTGQPETAWAASLALAQLTSPCAGSAAVA
jgi:hypothetical protein